MGVARIGVAGAGTMGAGIAQLACLGGFVAVIHDADPGALEAAEERIRADLLRGADRARWSLSDAEAASSRLRVARDLGGLAGCELVIEAAPEDLELKRELFDRLAETCGPGTVLATNTSSLPVGAIAARVESPERACGMHFFNPPTLMELVEVVAGEATSDATLATATEVAERLGRTPIRSADVVGFIANRCGRPYTLEALRLVGERIATPAAVDRIVRLGGGYRMGPFEVMDLVGIDVNLSVATSFYEQAGEERWRPHPLQARLVAEGRLGRKTGRGWYSYGDEPHRPEDPEPPDPDPEIELPGDPIAPVVAAGGARAYPLERGSLETIAGDDPDAVGYVALPTLADARLVELARGPATSDEAAADAEPYFRGLGKHVEWVADAPGLVLGRIVAQLVNEACFAAGDRVGLPDDIDVALRLGFNHPRGPFEWGEAIGAERVLAIVEALGRELAGDRYLPASLLRRWADEAAT